MDVSQIDRYLLQRSAKQRFAIGAVLVAVAPVLAQPNLGFVTKLSALCMLLGIVFLGFSVEPPLTRQFGADGWDDLSTGKQTAVLGVVVLAAIVLYSVIGFATGAIAAAL